MKLSDFILFPEPTIKLMDQIDLIPYDAPPVEDVEVQNLLNMMVAAETQNEVR